MASEPDRSIVRIFRGDSNTPVGAGFLIDQKHIFTCAHVVADALAIPRNVQEKPNGDIHLDFPLVTSKNRFSASVLHWRPVQQTPSLSSEDEEDIAVLELEVPPPALAQPASLLMANEVWEHSFQAFGFPDKHDNGTWTSGILRKPLANGWIQIEGVNQTGHRVMPGFSGTLVWDEQLKGGVGMVVESDKQESTKVAYTIPVTHLARVFPSLRQQPILPSPYRGLFAFREEDAAFFFGRETVTEGLVEVVHRNHFVPVIGASGSGKSSIVFAGLVSNLRQEGEWLVASFRPNDRPLRSLAMALLPLLEPQASGIRQLESIDKLIERLQSKDFALYDVLQQIVQQKSVSHMLLVADQFEEVYTLCQEPIERQSFLDGLLKAVHLSSDARTLDFHLVITLRADFLGYALSYGPLVEALQQNEKLMLGPMNRQQLRDAIEEPAKKCAVSIDDGLTDRILDAISNKPGNLPLLEFALDQLWGKQSESKLTEQAYEAIGGVEKALAVYAEEVYRDLSKKEKEEEIQKVFVQLVHPGGTEDTRRISTRRELKEDGWELARQLSDARLVVTDAPPKGPETAEIIHEALIQHWERLQKWVNADREFRSWQDRLRDALHQWQEGQEDEVPPLASALLSGAILWLKKKGQDLSIDEKDFLFRGILNRGIDIQQWTPLYGTIEETLSFLDRYYLTSKAESKVMRGIEALEGVPHPDQEMQVYDLLQQFVLNSSSSVIRDKAAQVIYERGDISRLMELLEPKKLKKQTRYQLIQALASIRNLPLVGSEIKTALKHSKRSILRASALQLLSTYRNQFALIVLSSYAFSQISYFLVQPLAVLFALLGIEPLSLSSFDLLDLLITVTIGLFYFIRMRIIDKKNISIGICFQIGIISSSLANFPAVFGVFTYLSSSNFGVYLYQIVSSFIGMSLLALAFRINFRSSHSNWRLLWIAGLSSMIAVIFTVSFLFILFPSNIPSNEPFYLTLLIILARFAPLCLQDILICFASLLGLKFGLRLTNLDQADV